MSKSEDIIKFTIKVQKDVWMDVFAAGRISASSLTWLMIDINIAIRGNIMSLLLEVFWELFNGLEEEFSSFFIGIGLVGLG